MRVIDELSIGFNELKLGVFAEKYQDIWDKCVADKLDYKEYLKMLVSMELEGRHHRRIKRLLKQANIPRVKEINDFKVDKIPGFEQSTVTKLVKGDFIDRAENLLIFGNPGTGKTHLSIALTREWCNARRKVLFMTAAELLQELLKAKASLRLNEYTNKINQYEVLVIDDISYIPCERNEADLLFLLLSSRYENKSIVITSNLAFAKWDSIFKDNMTTAATIDRLVHHSIILKLNAESYRKEFAKNSRD